MFSTVTSYREKLQVMKWFQKIESMQFFSWFKFHVLIESDMIET